VTGELYDTTGRLVTHLARGLVLQAGRDRTVCLDARQTRAHIPRGMS
jgi:hypothetical protein